MTEKPDGPTPGEHLVAQGAIVMQYENTEMRSFALAHRRNEQEVKDRALAILGADADAVENAYYSIPYKEHTRDRDAGCTGQQDDPCPVKPVEGVGIDGCRELARLWGNNATRVYFTEEDDERIWLSGVFVDLESNTRVEVPYGVSRLGVQRGGGVYTLNPTRLGMAIQAGVSKAARNAIAQGLPRSLRQAYFDKAKELIAGSAAIDVEKLVPAFETFSVTREMLEGLYGCPLEQLTAEQRSNLRGLFVAIREGLVDKDKHFAGVGGDETGGAPDGTGAPSQPSGGVSASPSAPSGTAEVRGGIEAAPAAPAAASAGLAPEPIPEPSPEQKAPTPQPAPTTESATAPAAAPGGPPNEEVSKGGTTRDKVAHLHPVPATAPFGRPPEAWETGKAARASYPNARTEAEWREEAELANAAARETGEKERVDQPPGAHQGDPLNPQPPAPETSQPTSAGVHSEAPNDDDTEPGQPDLKGLGI